jgi:hypothetical protein
MFSFIKQLIKKCREKTPPLTGWTFAQFEESHDPQTEISIYHHESGWIKKEVSNCMARYYSVCYRRPD